MQFTEKVKPDTLRLIEAEAKAFGVFRGRAFDRVIPQGCKSPEAKAILREMAESDPAIAAIVNAVLEEQNKAAHIKANSRSS